MWPSRYPVSCADRHCRVASDRVDDPATTFLELAGSLDYPLFIVTAAKAIGVKAA